MRARCAMMDILCRDGWRLNKTTSPSCRCRSTMSPNLSSDATRRRSPYFRYCVPPLLNLTKLAPGCRFMPLRTRSRTISMLCCDTTSGYVISLATCSGTPSSSMRRFGSGEMTVRPEKSTRFPLRLPRNRPCLPLRRCTNPRSGLPGPWNCSDSPGSSELMYMAHWICRKSQFSIRLVMASPLSRPCRSTLFTSMIWMSFIVMSSSLEPDTPSISTEGRIHTGGTGRCVRMRFSGRSATSRISQSVGEIFFRIPSTRMGLRSSCTRPRLARSCSLCFTASSNSPM
mmetsp:Transcript_21938/g.54256  ORF Transcript_21938/g.54256 Transcript_21938/m.54256 type:complete len:285 (-) Transcript_21938:948-1802(-)